MQISNRRLGEVYCKHANKETKKQTIKHDDLTNNISINLDKIKII